jgi:hypothetical protein
MRDDLRQLILELIVRQRHELGGGNRLSLDVVQLRRLLARHQIPDPYSNMKMVMLAAAPVRRLLSC